MPRKDDIEVRHKAEIERLRAVVLAALGLPRSVYYAWKARETLEDRAGKPCRVYDRIRNHRERLWQS